MPSEERVVNPSGENSKWIFVVVVVVHCFCCCCFFVVVVVFV